MGIGNAASNRSLNTATSFLNYLKRRNLLRNRQQYLFKPGTSYRLVLLASSHPSNQNTQTRKLTRLMFVEIFQEAARLADD